MQERSFSSSVQQTPVSIVIQSFFHVDWQFPHNVLIQILNDCVTVMASSEGRIDFSEANEQVEQSSAVPIWPVIEGGKILTDPFLKSCEVVAGCFGALGTLLLPVKNDVSGNIIKLRKVYNGNEEKYKYLEDMIQCERQIKGNIAVDALLWLKRALHLMYAIMDSLVIDSEQKNENQDISANYLTSYENTLLVHHNWALRKAFTVCINRGLMPYRRELLLAMPTSAGVRPDSSIDYLLEKLKPFLEGLKANLSAVITFYYSEGLDTSVSALK